MKDMKSMKNSVPKDRCPPQLIRKFRNKVFNKNKLKEVKVNFDNPEEIYKVNSANMARHMNNDLIGFPDEVINKMIDRNHIDMESERLKIDAFDKVMGIQGEFNCAVDYGEFYSDIVRVIHDWEGQVAKMQDDHRERFGE